MDFTSDKLYGCEHPLCHYGDHRTAFRGPKADLDRPHIVCLGGADTFGRQVSIPFPALLRDAIGMETVNLGVPNAGMDLWLKEAGFLDIAAQAQAVVLQIPGVQNMSNRYYMVHPRRNDRFLRASDVLMDMYPDIDFTEFHFNRHMLEKLHAAGSDRFARVKSELQTAWVARMKHLISLMRAPVVLLWLAPHSLDDWMPDDLRMDPLFVTRQMVDELDGFAAHLVEVTLPLVSFTGQRDGLLVQALGTGIGDNVLGQSRHHLIADQIAKGLPDLL